MAGDQDGRGEDGGSGAGKEEVLSDELGVQNLFVIHVDR